MKCNDDSTAYHSFDKYHRKGSNKLCEGSNGVNPDFDTCYELCKKKGSNICINNNPVIKICVGGSEPVDPTEPSRPFLSSYIEALGDTQTIPRNGSIVFDEESIDSVGDNIVLDSSGTVFTINRTGLYHVEWNLNLASGTTSAVVGIMENGEPASGASSSSGGNFSSGTLIQVDTVPFTLSLHNYGGEITIESIAPFENSAASIRIVRIADGPSE